MEDVGIIDFAIYERILLFEYILILYFSEKHKNPSYRRLSREELTEALIGGGREFVI